MNQTGDGGGGAAAAGAAFGGMLFLLVWLALAVLIIAGMWKTVLEGRSTGLGRAHPNL